MNNMMNWGGASTGNTPGGGTLFGGATAFNSRPSNNLFGSTAPPQNPGIFNTNPPSGNMFQNQGSSSNMFGGNTGAPTGSIFGGGNNTGGMSTGGSIFGQPATNAPLFNQPTNNPSMFSQNTNNMSNPMFSNTNTANTGGMGSGGSMFGQPATGATLFNQPTNNTNMFSQNTNNMAKPSFPTNNASNFNTFSNPTPSFGLTNPAPSTGLNFGFNNPTANKPPYRPFQPCKPRNDTVAKEKGNNSLVACVTGMDEYHTFSKEELRVMFYQNPNQMAASNNLGNMATSTVYGNSNTIFGSGNKMNTGPATPGNSIFGGTSNTPNSLFGNTGGTGFNMGNTQTNAMVAAGGSNLFGSNTTPNFGFTGASNTSGSLFNTNTTPGLTTGAVNEANRLSANLFTSTTAPTASGNLFGGGGSLFGNTGGNTGGGSLFQTNTGASTSAQGTGSLFSQTNQNNQNVAGALNQAAANLGLGLLSQSGNAGGSLFGGNTGSLFPGGSGLFPQNNPNMMAQTGMYSSQMMGYPGFNPQLYPPGYKLPDNSLFNITTPGPGGAAGANFGGFGSQPNQNHVFSSTQILSQNPQLMNAILKPQSSTQSNYSSSSNLIGAPNSLRFIENMANTIMSSLPDNRGPKSYVTNKYETAEFEEYQNARNNVQNRFRTDVVGRLKAQDFGFERPDQFAFTYKKPDRYRDDIKTYQQQDIYTRTRRPVTSYTPIFGSSRDDDDINREHEPRRNDPTPSSNLKRTTSKQVLQEPEHTKQLADEEDVPKCTRYNISPSISKLSRMTRQQLQAVPNVQIWNSFGKIKFTRNVNLLGKNLDQLVTIRQNSIEIDDSLNAQGCQMHFNNFGNFIQKVKSDSDIKAFKTRVSNWAKQQKLRMVSFNEKNGQLVTIFESDD